MAKNATKSVADDFTTVTFDFKNPAESSVKVVLDDLPEEIIAHAAAHGISQKLGDSYASADNPQDAFERFTKVLEELQQGNWSAPRQSGGGGARSVLVVEALARIAGKSLEEAQTVWDGLDDEKKKAVRAAADVKVAIAEIKAERAKAEAQKDGAQSVADLLAG